MRIILYLIEEIYEWTLVTGGVLLAFWGCQYAGRWLHINITVGWARVGAICVVIVAAILRGCMEDIEE